MIEFWDRTSLGIKRPPTPSEKSEEDGQHHPPSGSKRAKGKGNNTPQDVTHYILAVPQIYFCIAKLFLPHEVFKI